MDSSAAADETPPGPSLEVVAERLDRVSRRLEEDSDKAAASVRGEADAYEKGLHGWRRWSGPLGSVSGVLGAVFAAGIGWAVFAGENATDTEVGEAVESSRREHNGGVLEAEIDPADGIPYGPHPELQQAVHDNAKAIHDLAANQKADAKQDERMDKRVKYLYELGRWEAQSLERERKGLKPKPRPDNLDVLESDLIND